MQILPKINSPQFKPLGLSQIKLKYVLRIKKKKITKPLKEISHHNWE